MSDCLYCASTHLRKNGKLLSGGQRWKCVDCKKQFSTGGARETYAPAYKEKVVEMYCHTQAKAREVVEKFHISSRTLVKWKKEHVDGCERCHLTQPLPPL